MNVDLVFIDGYNNTPPLEPFDKDIFIDRRKNSQYLLMILAGYKSFLYEDVFARVKAFAPDYLDICIISSGVFDKTLNKIAAENNWSYLSTTQNNIPLVQNLAIMIHENAKFIFKMDEDIFLTEGVFDTVLKTAAHVQIHGHYHIGFVAPLIPLNSYGYIRLLEKLGLIETYEKIFEKPKFLVQVSRMLYSNPEVAKFFWGEGGFVPPIDLMNAAFRIQKISYSICSVRFSIGFIHFPRYLWEEMGGWKLPPPNSYGGGLDEEQICQFCALSSLGMIVAENALVGHFSFGGQTEAMKEYYFTHREIFRFPK